MSRRDAPPPDLDPMTRLVRAGRNPDVTGPFVNPPVVHASTVLFETAETMKPGGQKYTYGRQLTPTIEALCDAVTELEGGVGTVLCPSGLSAVTIALLSAVSAGDHLLIADNVYDPSRQFAARGLVRFGVEVEFFDPAIGAGIGALFRDNTRAVYVESPGSLTFEMTDIPAIAAAAHARGALVIADNTWATPLFFQPLAHGADLSLQAGTKYLAGHSDVMIGCVSAGAAAIERLQEAHRLFGLSAGPDDIYLTLRGLRTLGVRLERQMRSAIEIAEWLAGRGEVARVLHPALRGDPGHAIWRRDMSGASGLFGFVGRGWDDAEARAFLNALTLFGLGYSWGGFESLAVPAHLKRTATKWDAEGALIRLHIGLEDPSDLIRDLERALEAATASA